MATNKIEGANTIERQEAAVKAERKVQKEAREASIKAPGHQTPAYRGPLARRVV